MGTTRTGLPAMETGTERATTCSRKSSGDAWTDASQRRKSNGTFDFLVRFFRVLVGVAIAAVLLMGKAEESATDVLSSLSDGLTSTTPEEAALSSRLLALSELAHGMLLFAFAAIIVGMALVIAAGARSGGPVSLPCLGAGTPALLYLIASTSIGWEGQE